MNTDQLIVQIMVRQANLAALTVDQLRAVDTELARRAGMLGKSGQVSRPHAAVRRELANR